MAELCYVKEIQEEAETRFLTPSESEFPDREDTTVQDDGCKTPTSSDHKIPEIKQCPPAPRKPKPNRKPVKRKFTSENVSMNRTPIDLSREIELFFEDLDRRIKKSRRQEEEAEEC